MVELYTLAYFSTRINSARAERYLSNRDCKGVCQQQLLRSYNKKKNKKNLGIGWPASFEKAEKKMPAALIFPPVYMSGAPSTSTTRLPRIKDHKQGNDKETLVLLALFNRYIAKTHRRFTIT